MREYGIVSPMFWVGATGRSLRKDPNAQRVAIYLMTSPMSEMTGVYYCPLASILNDVGTLEASLKPLESPSKGGIDVLVSPFEGVKQAILTLMELDFCFYDFESEFVFVKEMARWQIGECLKEKDNRVIGLRKYVKSMPKPLAARFLERYNEDFCLGFDLDDYAEFLGEKTSPFEGASNRILQEEKPLRSQEQEQEYISTNVDKKEKYKKEKVQAKKSKATVDKPDGVSEQVWNDYLLNRKDKGAKTFTQTALNGLIREADKAGLTIEQAMTVCIERGWVGFNAEWIRQKTIGMNRGRNEPPSLPTESDFDFGDNDPMDVTF